MINSLLSDKFLRTDEFLIQERNEKTPNRRKINKTENSCIVDIKINARSD